MWYVHNPSVFKHNVSKNLFSPNCFYGFHPSPPLIWCLLAFVLPSTLCRWFSVATGVLFCFFLSYPGTAVVWFYFYFNVSAVKRHKEWDFYFRPFFWGGGGFNNYLRNRHRTWTATATQSKTVSSPSASQKWFKKCFSPHHLYSFIAH